MFYSTSGSNSTTTAGSFFVLVWLTLLLLLSFTPSIYHMAATVRWPKPTKGGARSSLPVPNNARLPNGPPLPLLPSCIFPSSWPFHAYLSSGSQIYSSKPCESHCMCLLSITHLAISACCPAARFPLVPPTLAPEAHPRHVGGHHKYSKSHTLCMAPLKSGPLNDGPGGGSSGAQCPRPGA